MHLQRMKTEIKDFFDENHKIETENFRKNKILMF